MKDRRPRLDVWVCARPGAPRLPEVWSALEAAGATPRLATATAGHGPAAARNEALAGCDGDVLVLVDDDVEVSAGWLEALRATWSAPGADRLGCVGGPLDAAFPSGRPAWLGDALLPGLGVDPGPPRAGGVSPGPVPVDAGKRTFHAGNISFRAAALRGVGGFWPARGSPGLRDWFGEEHRAQHELARAGWNAAWDPQAHAVRGIDRARLRPLEVIAMRAKAGSRSGAVGTASRSAAARAAASSTAGVLSALVRRDAEKLAERGARAAQRLGVLAAPMLAHRSLQPTTGRTPFAFSVPPPAQGPLRTASARLARRGTRRLNGGAPIVLLYHRVATSPHDPLALMVSPRHFAEQLEVLSTRRSPVTLEEIVAGEAPPSAFALTFDDGYVDLLDAALPALEAAGSPATIFVSTGHVDSGTAFWWDAVARMLRDAPADGRLLELGVDGARRAWPARDAAGRKAAFQNVAAWLHPRAPEVIDDELRAIAAWAHVGDPFAPSPEDRPLTVDELRRLAASPLVTIGAHGRRHPCLAALPPERRAEDLEAARDDILRWLGHSPGGLAYPFGVPGVDVDAATLAAARAAGYAYAVVNAPGASHRRADRMALGRVAPRDVDADAFDIWLRAI